MGNLHPDVAKALRELGGDQLSEDQHRRVAEAWDSMFRRLGVPWSEQYRDFEATMRMRAANGSISIVADDLDSIFGDPERQKGTRC